jgi:phosphatidylserine decarboxylase
MSDIVYIDRETKKEELEKVYGKAFVKTLYGKGALSNLASFLLSPMLCKSPVFSHCYGFLQKSCLSKRKIKPFIKAFGVDEREFLEKVDSFKSFNEFFVRKLKSEARPLAVGNDIAVLPADARYLFYPQIDEADGFIVKGEKFSLEELLQDDELAARYQKGAMMIARLCPTDYHRFHFPCTCIPEEARLINGGLASVNPLAVRKNIRIFSQNKRTLTKLYTKNFGMVLYLEIGATCVGGIHQTYTPNEPYAKGDEKGYFSFGGSSLVILFEPNTIQFDQDLLEASQKKIEIRGLLGQSMGRSLIPL